MVPRRINMAARDWSVLMTSHQCHPRSRILKLDTHVSNSRCAVKVPGLGFLVGGIFSVVSGGVAGRNSSLCFVWVSHMLGSIVKWKFLIKTFHSTKIRPSFYCYIACLAVSCNIDFEAMKTVISSDIYYWEYRQIYFQTWCDFYLFVLSFNIVFIQSLFSITVYGSPGFGYQSTALVQCRASGFRCWRLDQDEGRSRMDVLLWASIRSTWD